MCFKGTAHEKKLKIILSWSEPGAGIQISDPQHSQWIQSKWPDKSTTSYAMLDFERVIEYL